MKLGEEGEAPPVPVIPSGSVGLDLALGVGGYPRGRVIEIFGPESSGKTTLALHAIAEAQRAGGRGLAQADGVEAEGAIENVARQAAEIGRQGIVRQRWVPVTTLESAAVVEYACPIDCSGLQVHVVIEFKEALGTVAFGVVLPNLRSQLLDLLFDQPAVVVVGDVGPEGAAPDVRAASVDALAAATPDACPPTRQPRQVALVQVGVVVRIDELNPVTGEIEVLLLSHVAEPIAGWCARQPRPDAVAQFTSSNRVVG